MKPLLASRVALRIAFDRGLGVALFAVVAGLAACHADSTGAPINDGPDAESRAGAPGVEEPSGPADATIAPDGGASDATSQSAPTAALDGDGEGTSAGGEVCHVVWPQTEPYPFAPGSMELAVDPSGNTFVEIEYQGNAPVTFGVPSPGYPVGVAIAKIDPDCHLLWMRDFGMPADAGSASIYGSIAVDATGSVTFAGWYLGTVDLGAGAMNSALLSGFVMRLDASGDTVFRNLYPIVEPHVLAVDATGTASVLMAGLVQFESPDGAATNTYTFAQIDATGNEVTQNSFSALTDLDVVAGTTESMWVVSGGALQIVDTLGAVVESWALTGNEGTFALGPAGLVALASAYVPSRSETIEVFPADGGRPSTPAQAGPIPVDAPEATQLAVDSTGTIYAGGEQPTPAQPPPDATCCDLLVGAQVLTASGGLRSVRLWQDGNYAQFGAIAVDATGHAMIGGQIDDPHGGTSFFVVKLGL